MTRGRAVIAAALGLGAIVFGGWQASADTQAMQLRRDYGHVEIRRIGDFSPSFKDFQDTALLNAFAYLREAGVPPSALRRAAIEPVFRIGIAGRSTFGQPQFYKLWLAADGCDRNFFFRASTTGRLVEIDDKGDCLGAGAS